MGKGGRTGGNKSSEEALSGVYEGPGSPLQLDCGILEAGSWPSQDLAHGENQGTRLQGAMSQHAAQ